MPLYPLHPFQSWQKKITQPADRLIHGPVLPEDMRLKLALQNLIISAGAGKIIRHLTNSKILGCAAAAFSIPFIWRRLKSNGFDIVNKANAEENAANIPWHDIKSRLLSAFAAFFTYRKTGSIRLALSAGVLVNIAAYRYISKNCGFFKAMPDTTTVKSSLPASAGFEVKIYSHLT